MHKPSIFELNPQPLAELSNVSRTQFDQEIRPASQPVIMRGLVNDWPAVAAGKNGPEQIADHLRSLDVGANVPTFIARPEVRGRYFYAPDMLGFNFEVRDVPFRALLDKLLEQLEDPAPMGIYAGASPTTQTLPTFAHHNEMPLVEPNVVPKVWVGNSAQVAPHFDISDNIACVVSGVRRFVVFPPDQIENLYVGPIDYNMAGQPASLVDLNAIDLSKFPKFQRAIESAMVAELHPGDALYMPSLWWHFVESTGPFNVLVNYWFDTLRHGSPMNVLALALLVLRDLPDSDREAWRSVFDHYVFGENAGASADHIPPEFRGALAEQSPERNQKIKAFLTAQLPSVLR
ncbi:MAG: cupin-like domain-containing protein [Hyphomonas sp.]|nr:cupin-like domain-containing protein [Hyphomonas sp.]